MSPCKRICCVVGIITLLALIMPDHLVFSQDDERTRTTLAGLKSIYLLIEPVDPEVEEKGLTTRQLRSDAEKKLRKAGIKLLSEEEYDRFKSVRSYPLARLEVITDVQEIKDTDLRVYNIIVQIRQVVWLARKPVVNLTGVTWKKQEFGYSRSLNVVRDKVKETVGQFITAYLAVNQK
ncbi:MAG: hypothetical protein JRD02_00225 [Deltaproteobacteria bacterium]|nr:hypothetical protein [Deltaproteobacteria bacterium]